MPTIADTTNPLVNQLKKKRFTEPEIQFIRSTFKDPESLKILRKALWPDLDWTAPIGQTKVGMWVGLDQLMQMAPQDREVVILTQIRLNNIVESVLQELFILANSETETEEAKKEREAKDSVK